MVKALGSALPPLKPGQFLLYSDGPKLFCVADGYA